MRELNSGLRTAGYHSVAPIYSHELKPSCSGPAATGDCVDATLEEVWHVITGLGYAAVRVQHSHWSRPIQILCSDWWNFNMLASGSMP